MYYEKFRPEVTKKIKTNMSRNSSQYPSQCSWTCTYWLIWRWQKCSPYYRMFLLKNCWVGLFLKKLPLWTLFWWNLQYTVIENMKYFIFLWAMVKVHFSIKIANNAKNTVILQTMWKLCHSAKFPHQEFRWNYGIFGSENSSIKSSLWSFW